MRIKNIVFLFFMPLFFTSFGQPIKPQQDKDSEIKALREKVHTIIASDNLYSESNVNEMADIFVKLLEFRKKKINPDSKFCNYFNRPEELLEKNLNVKVIWPEYGKVKSDLQRETRPGETFIWPNAIDWDRQFHLVEDEWGDSLIEKINKKKIKSSELVSHLSKRLILFAKAYLNKNKELEKLEFNNKIKLIKADSLFKKALYFLDPELLKSFKYKKIIRALLTKRSSHWNLINLLNLDLENSDLPFLFFLITLQSENVKEVWLSDNNITKIPENLCAGLSSLSILNLNNNKIIKLPISFGEGKLVYVSLKNNQIRGIPKNFLDYLQELETIDLSSNKIKMLPDDFGNKWRDLSEIDLSGNQISNLSNEFGGKWNKITGVDLSSNKIEELQNDFGKSWKELKEIDLSNNNLTRLPKNFGEYWPKDVKINIKNAGENNQPITISVEQSKAEWLKSNFYVYNEPAEENKDYVFEIIKPKLTIDVEKKEDSGEKEEIAVLISPWQKAKEYLRELFRTPMGSPKVSPEKSPKD